jgi:hypothetical protein
MDNKFLAVVAVALAAVTAAGVGSYLAVRERVQPVAAEAVAPGAEPAAQAEQAATPVTETEALLSTAEEPATPSGAAAGATTLSRESKPPVAAAAPTTSAPVASAPPTVRTPARPAAARTAPATTAARRDAPQRPATTRAASSVPAATAAEPSGASGDAPPSASTRPAREPAGAEPFEPRPSPAPARAAEVPVEPVETAPVYEELVVPADAVVGLQVDSTITSERARVEDPVNARITRDVRVGGRVAIPAGSRVHGTVTLVERGGKIKDRARLGVRFHTLVLADGTRVPLATETLYREGESVGRSSAAKIGGGAVGGAIIGAILGGGKGAAIGAATGAGGGTAAAMAGDRKPATLPAGSSVTVRLNAPASVTVEKTSTRDPRDR